MVILLPFAPKMMQLDATVRSMIDMAYANICKFHKAQASRDILMVKMMQLNCREEHDVKTWAQGWQGWEMVQLA